MNTDLLIEKINAKQARLAVIGLGYVGLPVACAFARQGFDVVGIEIKQERVDKINQGQSPIEGDEPGLADLLASVVSAGKLLATSDYQSLADRDVILIDVETPVDEHHIPRYAALRSVVKSLGPVIKDGALVIVESTIAPSTMRDLVCPELEASSGKKVNVDFGLGNCPERVMPGKLLSNLVSLSRVCGGGNPETAEAMVQLYKHIVKADLDPVDWITAELVKTVENSYRDVQIAFANEVALICEALGGDAWKVRELVNKSPYRQMHLPGAGVGGHCIPKDPWLLVYGVQDRQVPVRLIPTARMVNDSMPVHTADLLEKGLGKLNQPVAGSTVVVLGYAYLENSDDTRNSPSEVLVEDLRGRGANVVVHDPYVEGFIGDVIEQARGADALVVMVAHQAYKDLDLKQLRQALKLPLLIDGRGIYPKKLAEEAGFVYYGIGMGASEE